MSLTILFENDDVLVADKPPGIATEPDRDRRVCLRDLVDAHLAKRSPNLRSHAVSRLDTPVSGCVTFALSRRAKAFASAEPAGLQKRYVAITKGGLRGGGSWTSPVDSRPAESRYRALGHVEIAQGELTLLELEPVTGRTHQLRIHASRGDVPILGDRKYGGPGTVVTRSGRVLSLPRVLLHAGLVVLPATLVGELREVRSPIPSDLRELWSASGGEEGVWESLWPR